MNQQPDELFRQKLEGLQKPAPATAWKKIAAAQNKKSSHGLWLKIAASLLVLALAIYTRWPEAPASETVSGVVNEEATEQPAIAALPPHQNNETAAVDVQKKPAAKQEKYSSVPHTEPREPDTTTKISDSGISQSVVVSVPEADTVSSTEYAGSSVPEPSNLQANESITMIFTAREVNEYLHKKEIKEIPEATDATKKPSNWKKLLQRANDLTNNQDPFGELRQKKNEIFALNFRNEKQRGQNK